MFGMHIISQTPKTTRLLTSELKITALEFSSKFWSGWIPLETQGNSTKLEKYFCLLFIYSDPKSLVCTQIFQRIKTTVGTKYKLLKEFTPLREWLSQVQETVFQQQLDPLLVRTPGKPP